MLLKAQNAAYRAEDEAAVCLATSTSLSKESRQENAHMQENYRSTSLTQETPDRRGRAFKHWQTDKIRQEAEENYASLQTGSTTFCLVRSINLNNQTERAGLSPPFDPPTIPVAKTPVLLCLNDCHPVPVTPIVTKCFEWLVKPHIAANLLASLTEDKVYTTLHTALTHLENTCARILHFDFSVEHNQTPHLPLDPGFYDRKTTVNLHW